jgi:hypothetical protein
MSFRTHSVYWIGSFVDHRNTEQDTVSAEEAGRLLDNTGDKTRYVGGKRVRCRVPLSNEVLFSIGVITTALQGGGLIFGFSAFANAIVELEDSPYHHDIAKATSIFTWGHTITALMSVPAGFLCDSYGPRATAVSGLLIEALGHYLMTQVRTLPEMATWIGYGMIGLGGCQVLLAALNFCGAFKNQGLVSSIMTIAFQAGGFIFMGLNLPSCNWNAFFRVYMVSCLVSAAVVAVCYPDAPLVNNEVEAEVQSEVDRLTTAMTREPTLKQLLLRPGTIGFLITFAVTGSALTYGISEFPTALQRWDDCVWVAAEEKFVLQAAVTTKAAQQHLDAFCWKFQPTCCTGIGMDHR